MNNELIRTFSFNDANVRIVCDEHGEPWWGVAADVCDVLGISRHRDAVTRLESDERGSVVVDTLGGPQKTVAVCLPGLNRLIASSRKPDARQFQRWLFHEVLPSIYRTGGYSLQPALSDESRRLQLAEIREARLSRQLKHRALKDLVKTLRRSGHVSEDVIVSYEIAATELATERDFSALKPAAEEGWESPTPIASRFGVSSQRIGRVITKLGFRGNHDGLSKAIVNKAQGHDRTVTSYLYSPEAVRRIEAELRSAALVNGGSQ